MRLKWNFQEVDENLKNIMEDIFESILETCKEFNLKDDYVAGANITGFKKVADAMISQGVV